MNSNVLIVEAVFYPQIAKSLRDGAIAELEAAGARYDCITVPGALEIPPAILFAADVRSGRKGYDGFVALGCVLRGETYHFEIVADGSAGGLMELSLRHELCIGNGILTCDTEEQAIVRADPGRGDKGGDAARACLALIEVRAKLEGRA